MLSNTTSVPRALLRDLRDNFIVLEDGTSVDHLNVPGEEKLKARLDPSRLEVKVDTRFEASADRDLGRIQLQKVSNRSAPLVAEIGELVQPSEE